MATSDVFLIDNMEYMAGILYKWTFSKFAKIGDKIFDSNLGSQSSRIAAYEMGFYFCGCEVNKSHFTNGNKRFENYKSQQKLFTFDEQL